jgi:DNA polymerase (family X)
MWVNLMNKNQVAEILEEIAVLLELKGENVFKIRAFENAARILAGHPRDLGTLIETGELETLKGIGKGHIAQIVRELYAKGKSQDHE